MSKGNLVQKLAFGKSQALIIKPWQYVIAQRRELGEVFVVQGQNVTPIRISARESTVCGEVYTADSIVLYLFIFISPLFNQVGQLRTSSHLQLRPGQDKAQQCDTNNNTVTHGVNKHAVNNTIEKVYIQCVKMRQDKGGKEKNSPQWRNNYNLANKHRSYR